MQPNESNPQNANEVSVDLHEPPQQPSSPHPQLQDPPQPVEPPANPAPGYSATPELPPPAAPSSPMQSVVQPAQAIPPAQPTQPPPLAPQPIANVPSPPTYIEPKSKRKLLIATAAIVVAVIAVGGAAFAIWKGDQGSPDAVFKAAVSNSLVTKQVEMTMLATASGQTMEQFDDKYDFSNMKNVRISGVSTQNLFGITLKSNNYCTQQDEYYASLEVNGKAVPTAELGKWAHTMHDGNALQPTGSNISVTTNPECFEEAMPGLTEGWPIGNYSPSARQALAQDMINEFKYDPAQVIKSTYYGHKVYVYNLLSKDYVDENKDIVEKIGQSTGLASGEISFLVSSSGDSPGQYKASGKLYIDISSKRLLHIDVAVESSGDKATETVDFSHYDEVAVPPTPKPQITVDQYDAAFKGSGMYGTTQVLSVDN